MDDRMNMTPEAFVAKWDPSTLKESAGSQEHFIDLCRLVGVKTPAEADPEGEWFTFERGAKKTGGGDGWADVWRKGCFAWEYKGKHKDLSAAYRQLQRYGPALDNPPLLVVSDMDRIQIHANFTNTKQVTYELRIQDLADPEQRAYLEAAFKDPERLRPGETREYITAEAARKFAALAEELRQAGYERLRVAHFITRMLFCMFAEDIGILPRHLFTEMLEHAREAPEDFQGMASDLFGAMHSGGRVGFERVDWFNGGLFDDNDALPLNRKQIDLALAAAYLDWSAIEPSILGTLFERGMDPRKRGQLGAHYTDPETINKLVYPVVIEPLEREWAFVRAEIDAHMEAAHRIKNPKPRLQKAQTTLQQFLLRLRKYTVLDPACGSGNFLYLALKGLKDFENRVGLEAESLGLERHLPDVGVANMRGIEISPYAAELARVTLWIGEIQWMLEHGFSLDKKPILKPLNQVEERDALVTEGGLEAEWPEAEAIVGNPPFIGDRRMIAELGEQAETIRAAYKDRVPRGADFVTYWFEKARHAIEKGRSRRCGLVATNSIRHGQNRRVLERVITVAPIFTAWSDQPWINEGAAVRVSLIAFANAEDPCSANPVLDGHPVDEIYANLTGGDVDITQAVRLNENAGIACQGITKSGAFDVSGAVARQWLAEPNPDGRSNAEVLAPLINGQDLLRRPSDRWLVNFGGECSQPVAALYEAPYRYVEDNVYKPLADKVGRKRADGTIQSWMESQFAAWWRLWRPRTSMVCAVGRLGRYIATPRVAKHRLFVWVSGTVWPDSALVAIMRNDDVSFGILHSYLHKIWSLRMGSFLGKGNDPRYTPNSTFETFPFPPGLEPNRSPTDFDSPHAEAIAEAARNIDTLRERWLNPPEWTERVPEVVEGYPDRIVAKPGCEDKLKQRTLTKLYNECPAWLDHAHEALDKAVAAAYGWEWPLDDETILARLLELDLSRGEAGR
jgi:type II restriction/modification system DNA methylase subunit YeeA